LCSYTERRCLVSTRLTGRGVSDNKTRFLLRKANRANAIRTDRRSIHFDYRLIRSDVFIGFRTLGEESSDGVANVFWMSTAACWAVQKAKRKVSRYLLMSRGPNFLLLSVSTSECDRQGKLLSRKDRICCFWYLTDAERCGFIACIALDGRCSKSQMRTSDLDRETTPSGDGWTSYVHPSSRCFFLLFGETCLFGSVQKWSQKRKVSFFLGNLKNHDRNLVDPASSHMLILKIKPCMSKYK